MKIYFLEKRIVTRYPSITDNGYLEMEFKTVHYLVSDGEFTIVRPVEYMHNINDSVYETFSEFKKTLKDSKLDFRLTKLGDL